MALTAARLARLREGSFMSAGHRIYIQDGETLQDAADLYAVLSEHAQTGSPNLENSIVRAFVEQIQAGQLLSNDQLAKLLQLVKKYKGELKAYREDPDDSQDILNAPSGATAKILS